MANLMEDAGLGYRDDILFMEDVEIERIAKMQGSPLYIYSHTALVNNFNKLKSAFSSRDVQICYAVKANPSKAILKAFFNLGAGADVVSGGELRRALWAGCDPQKIVFSGVGKTSEEIHLALNENILQFNVESEAELHNIQRIASFLDKKARIAIRVNPDVDPKTHPYISTGLKKNKFGVDPEQAIELYRLAKNFSHIEITGMACHIGSQLMDVQPFMDAFDKIGKLVKNLEEQGISLKQIDVGGGLGIPYKPEDATPDVKDYAKRILEVLKNFSGKIILEPGRFLVGNAGILVAKVIYLKKNSSEKHFTIIDAGFNDLMRPMLYEAYHHIIPVRKVANRPDVTTDVVGSICETTDTMASDRTMPLQGPGEYMAILTAGAYGASMSSTYNSHGRCSEIMVRGNQFYVIRKPDRLEDLVAREEFPEFMKERS